MYKSITQFEEGITWTIEELAMNGKKDAILVLWNGSLSSFREGLIKIMKMNNPEIYKNRVYPFIKEIRGFRKNKL